MSNPDLASLEAQARRRVGMKMGFYIHALVYVLVNAGLFVLNNMHGGPSWHFYPLLGWGLGLAIHGLVVFISLNGGGVRERMLAREIDSLKRRER